MWTSVRILVCACFGLAVLSPRARADSNTLDRARSGTNEDHPPELGAVHFGRDLDAALATSRTSGKPLFVLFQEIPGCATCKGFGAGPLSHPLLVEAIETQFEPVAIYNNRDGADARALARFHEPAWNNPVVRFLDADGHDSLPREDGVWTAHAIAERMIGALATAKRPMPEWLALARDELDPTPPEHATFAMHCYWEGQGALGGIDGVVAVRPRLVEGREAVEVAFQAKKIAYAELVRRADHLDCAAAVYAHDDEQAKVARAIVGERVKRLPSTVRDAGASEYLYHLQHSSLRFVPLTDLQATRVNADLAFGRDATRWLSPAQKKIAGAIDALLRTKPSALDGLTRPQATSALATYRTALEERLPQAAR